MHTATSNVLQRHLHLNNMQKSSFSNNQKINAVSPIYEPVKCYEWTECLEAVATTPLSAEES